MDIEEWINTNPGFENYMIQEIHEILAGSGNESIIVTDSQIDYITKWCVEKGVNIRLLRFFIERFKIILPAEKLLSLTGYVDYNQLLKVKEPGTIEFLEQYLSIVQLRQQVGINVQKGITDILVWISNAGYALRNNYTKTYDTIIDLIEQSVTEEYKLAQVLELWYEKTGDTNRLFEFAAKAGSGSTIFRRVKNQRLR